MNNWVARTKLMIYPTSKSFQSKNGFRHYPLRCWQLRKRVAWVLLHVQIIWRNWFLGWRKFKAALQRRRKSIRQRNRELFSHTKSTSSPLVAILPSWHRIPPSGAISSRMRLLSTLYEKLNRKKKNDNFPFSCSEAVAIPKKRTKMIMGRIWFLAIASAMLSRENVETNSLTSNGFGCTRNEAMRIWMKQGGSGSKIFTITNPELWGRPMLLR